jgi:hypothetical protein
MIPLNIQMDAGSENKGTLGSNNKGLFIWNPKPSKFPVAYLLLYTLMQMHVKLTLFKNNNLEVVRTDVNFFHPESEDTKYFAKVMSAENSRAETWTVAFYR